MAASDSPSFEVLIAVQRLAQGGLLAFPVASPELALYDSEGEWQEEMRRGLEKLLPSLAPETLAGLLGRRGELLEVEVELDLRARELDRGGSLHGLFPCLVTVEANDRWVTVLRLGHSFHAAAREDLPALAAAEIRRVLRARLASGEDPLLLLPPLATELILLPIRLGPPRKRDGKALQRAEDLALLGQIGSLLAPSAAGLLARPEEEARLAALLGGPRRGSLLVVGADGVGKSSLLRRFLAGREQVYLTSGYQWVAGQSMLGQLEERVQQVMAAAARLDAWLYFERFDELLTSRGDSQDLLALFRRFVVAGKVRFLGELSSDRLDEARRAHSSLFAALDILRLEPMDAAATHALLLARLAAFLPEAEHEALRESLADLLIELCRRYFAAKPLPGMAVQLLDELKALEVAERQQERHIGLADLYRLVSSRTGIPEFLLQEDVALRLGPLRESFRAGLIGQDEAVEELVGVLCAVKARLQPEGKPLAVLLFVGPTGVGKTEAARCLARLLFGDEERLIRFDMSEYSDPYAAERLIRGNDREEGLLTRRVRREPFAVLLLDEIEKADHAVFDLLLQVAGEGRLTDARGRTASFHNVILILTSNLGATEQRSGRLGFGDEALGAADFYRAQVEGFFRPEMVNRLDRVITFLPLSRDEISRITRLQLRGLARRRGFEERAVKLEVSDAVVEQLAQRGYAPAHGARRLRRELQQHLIAPAAELIARSAPRAYQALLRVCREDEAGPAQGALARQVTGGFCFELRRDEAARQTTAAGSDLDALQNFRRLLRRLFAAPSLANLLTEIRVSKRRLFAIQIQLQQLGEESRRRGQPKPRHGPELIAEANRLEQRRSRYEQLAEPLRLLLQEVEDSEELALAEIFAGQDPGKMASRLEGWHERLRRSLGPALLALDESAPLTLLLHEADGRRAFDFWLRSLLEFAGKNELPLGGWPLGEKTRLDGASQLSRAELLSWLDGPQRPRQLILEVVDATWAARLAWEAGWHRFTPAEQKDAAAHLEIARFLRGRSTEAQREKLRRNHLRKAPMASEILRRVPLLRAFRIEADWWWPERSSTSLPPCSEREEAWLRQGGLLLPPLRAGDYWPRQLELLSRQLAIYELSADADRDEDLSQRLPGGEK